MADCREGRSTYLMGIDTNQGGVDISYPEQTDLVYFGVTCDGEVIDSNQDGVCIPYRETTDRSRAVMVSFIGNKSKELIGTFGNKELKVCPRIGVNMNTIQTSQIPGSYKTAPGTGLYFDTNKVDLQYSYCIKINGVVQKKVVSAFPGPKVETIRDGVCRMCLQKTNHTSEECPAGDLGFLSDENRGPYQRIPIICKPLCKENAIENGVRFNLAPEKADENELRAIFEEYGKVKKLYLIRDEVTGVSQRAGFANFVNIDDAERALDALKDQLQMYWFVF